MKFLIHNLWTKFEGSVEEENLLDRFLAVQDPARFHSRLFRQKIWDGYHRFYNRRRRGFPSGLINYVVGKCEKNNVPFEIVDGRVKPEPLGKDFDLDDFTPRDYQIKAAQIAVEQGRAIIHAATNSGKTEIAAMIMKKLGLPTLYIVHTNELLMQTKKRFEMRGLNGVGIIGGGNYQPGLINISMVQTLYRYRYAEQVTELLNNSKVLFIDECQHLAANTYYWLVMRCNAYYRYGLSGTPFRKDIFSDMRLLGATGSVLPVKIDNQFMITEGYSAIPYIVMIDTPRLYTMMNPISYAKVYDLFVKNNTLRNTAVVDATEKLCGQGKQVLVVVRQIDHGENLLELFRQRNNYIAEFVHGSSGYEQRDEALNKFRNKQIDVLIASTIFDEGIDVPEIHAVVLAVGEKSPIKLLQRIGRGLRRKENNYLTIVDFNDTDHRYVTKHTQERKLVYVQQGFKLFHGSEHLDDVSKLENNELLKSE